MQTLDLVIIVLLGLFALRGLLKGFTGEFISLASVALAVIAAVFLFKNVAVFLREHYLQMPLLPEILAFAAIFLAVFIAGKLIEKVVKDIVDRLNIETLDKALGLILGLAKGFALVSLVLFLLLIQPFFDSSPLMDKSLFVRLLLPFIGAFHV